MLPVYGAFYGCNGLFSLHAKSREEITLGKSRLFSLFLGILQLLQLYIPFNTKMDFWMNMNLELLAYH